MYPKLHNCVSVSKWLFGQMFGINAKIIVLFFKAVTYDKQLKMKRDTQQKSSPFTKKKTTLLLGISFHFQLFVVHYCFSGLSIVRADTKKNKTSFGYLKHISEAP